LTVVITVLARSSSWLCTSATRASTCCCPASVPPDSVTAPPATSKLIVPSLAVVIARVCAVPPVTSGAPDVPPSVTSTVPSLAKLVAMSA
jgi:hypothetical protein